MVNTISPSFIITISTVIYLSVLTVTKKKEFRAECCEIVRAIRTTQTHSRITDEIVINFVAIQCPDAG